MRAQHLVVPVSAPWRSHRRAANAGADGAAERINAMPTLGICLGLRLFGRGSDESPGHGLGCVALQAVGFNDSLVTPQMGWNRVVASPEAELLTSGYAYFANSYRFEQIPEGMVWRHE